MGKTIVWVSRHVPLPSQLKELERLFPGYQLVIEKRPFSSAKQIVQRYREAGGEEMVTVAPWSVIRELIKLGMKPIYAEMAQVDSVRDAETTIVTGKTRKKRYYKFIRFAYCTDVSLKLVPILPPEGKNVRHVSHSATQSVLLNPDGSVRAIIK